MALLRRFANQSVSILALLFVVLPVALLISASFQTRAELFSVPPRLFPRTLHFENYVEVFADPVVIRSLLNSTIVSTSVVLLSLALGSLAAYSFVRLPFPAKNILFVAILLTQMLPSIAILIPLYLVMRRLGLISTYPGLILSYLPYTLPYTIWLLRSFFLSIPSDIEEQALLDGCTRISLIPRIVIPLSLNGFLSTGIFAFIGVWNEFMMASVLTNNATKTFPVRLTQFIGEETTSYEHMFAAAVVGLLPVVLMVILFRSRIVKGLSDGGVK